MFKKILEFYSLKQVRNHKLHKVIMEAIAQFDLPFQRGSDLLLNIQFIYDGYFITLTHSLLKELKRKNLIK